MHKNHIKRPYNLISIIDKTVFTVQFGYKSHVVPKAGNFFIYKRQYLLPAGFNKTIFFTLLAIKPIFFCARKRKDQMLAKFYQNLKVLFSMYSIPGVDNQFCFNHQLVFIQCVNSKTIRKNLLKIFIQQVIYFIFSVIRYCNLSVEIKVTLSKLSLTTLFRESSIIDT